MNGLPVYINSRLYEGVYKILSADLLTMMSSLTPLTP